MFRFLILLPCFAMMTFCASRQLSGGLPKPHYRPDASDPKWLVGCSTHPVLGNGQTRGPAVVRRTT